MHRSIALGCNFFDTALAYGDGRSERLLATVLREHRDKQLYVATKVPPKNGKWPAAKDAVLADVFPPEHIRKSTEQSLSNLGIDCIDLQQLHVWTDSWATDDSWKRAAEDLKRDGLVRGFGISVNRWEPANVLAALETGLVDAVQVVYNIFDQSPEDELFPACERHNIAVIARVPFDEGSLTGQLKLGMQWPKGDWRNLYFTPERLKETLEHVERLKPLVPEGSSLADMALRFILQHPAVSTTIPGMRKLGNVERNIASSDASPLPATTRDALRAHRWDRSVVIP